MIPNNIIEVVLNAFGDDMAKCMQNTMYHGEGDVLSHTNMVLNVLHDMDQWKRLDETMRFVLDASAVFHDIGKTRTTVLENGVPASPKHSLSSAKMAREFMWKELNMCGDIESTMLREAVCWLVRNHSFPLWAVYKNNVHIKLQRLAANSILSPYFSVSALCLLSKADVLGRICKENGELLERIEFCEELAKEDGCFEMTYMFPNARTRRLYLLGKDVWKDSELYDDTWGEVVIVSGLPGTGKDTWISQNFHGMPMVSLDNIRKENRISPCDEQGLVVNLAKDTSKEYLRNRIPFVWNATNLTKKIREQLVNLFESYGAKVRIVYLETAWDELIDRNKSRENVVPVSAIERMLSKTQPPETMEADTVEWFCV